MCALRLEIPHSRTNASELPNVGTGELRVWLSHLRLTDVEQSAYSVISSIEQHNHYTIDPMYRVQLMDMFVPVITQLIGALRGKLKGCTFPLSSKNNEHAELIKQIMQGMANGYKTALLDLDAGKGSPDKSEAALLNATYASIKYLAEQLLSAWLVYSPEPQGVWAEIHHLYRYAEQMDICNKAVPEHLGEKPTANTIQHLYKRVVLLAISNPYHLMEGEAPTILNYLNNWAIKCTITPHPKDTVVNNQFYVDLESQEPPQFASDHTEHKLRQGRIIGVDALSGGLSRLIHNITERFKGKKMPLQDCMNRDMLIRLQNAWGGRINRQFERFPDSSSVLLSTGLGASHYYVSGQKEFEPEKDEISYMKNTRSDSGLSLVALDDHDHWKQQELQDKIEAGVTQHRKSSFDDKSADVWGKIHATKAHYQSLLEEQTGSQHNTTEWNKFNKSQGGLGLTSTDISDAKIRVGDLVAYSEENGNGWVLGALRWLNNTDNQKLDMGIMTISENAIAVGVRSISGMGAGGEYFRALTCVKDINGKEIHTIIVPSNIFDNASELVLNYGGDIKYIRLEQIIDTTSSYSQFRFEFIDKPEDNVFLKKYFQGT